MIERCEQYFVEHFIDTENTDTQGQAGKSDGYANTADSINQSAPTMKQFEDVIQQL